LHPVQQITKPETSTLASTLAVPISCFWCPLNNPKEKLFSACYMDDTITCVQCYVNHVFFQNRDIHGITVDPSYQEELFFKQFRKK